MPVDGVKVGMLVQGSRGDCQPYIALALRLQEEGFVVRIFTNENHIGMMKDFGLDGSHVFVDSEAFYQNDPDVVKAMESGSLDDFFASLGKHTSVEFPKSIKRGFDAMEQFQPEVLCFSGTEGLMGALYMYVHKVPAIPIPLQSAVYTGEQPPFGMRAMPLSCMNRMMWRKMYAKLTDMGKPALQCAQDVLGQEDLTHSIPSSVSGFIAEAFYPTTPRLLGVSGHLAPMPKDFNSLMHHTTGFWVLDSKQQQERFLSGDPRFGGEQAAEIQAFLAQAWHGPPVYMGWGSMIGGSAAHMTTLAVSSLRALGRRGIVLQGWSGLGPKHLEGEDLEYAKSSVLFVKSAPHEWLLPQCEVAVIHGGAGTTAAVLRSGRPCVITPVFLDQFDFAREVNRLRVGIGLQQFQKVTKDILVKAVNQCINDKQLLARTAALGEKLRAEDGIGNATAELRRFVEGPLQSGKWLQDYNTLIDRRRAGKDFMPGGGGGGSCWDGLFCCF